MEQNIVVPSVRELEIESGGSICPVEGCGRQFQSSSQLQMHLAKRHQSGELRHKIGSSVFYCPADNCERNLSGGKPFPRLGQLKQHYQRIHGSKNYSCQKCGRQFSLKDAHGRHEAECGRVFRCESCGEELKTRNALYKHALRKGHTLPEGTKVREKKRSPLLSNSRPVGPISQSIILKPVVKLARLVSASTQTEADNHECTGNRTDSGSQVRQVPPPIPEYSVDPLSSTMLLDLSTQTDPSRTDDRSFDLSDLAIQTDLRDNFDFGTQTTVQITTQSSQTGDHTHTQSCQTYILPELCTPGTDPIRDHVPHSGVMQELTPDDLSVEFGTQTLDPHSFVTPGDFLADFGTQTQPPHDLQSLAATQTTHDDILVEFGTQTLPPNTQSLPTSQITPDDLLIDFGTQTNMASHSQMDGRTQSYSDMSVEFGTQTSSADPQALLGMGTQTEEDLFYAHLAGLTRTDFGTQTIDELFSEVSSLFSSGSVEPQQGDVSQSAGVVIEPLVGGPNFGVKGGSQHQQPHRCD